MAWRVITVLLVILLGFAAWVWFQHPYRKRLSWKNEAIPQIQELADDQKWVASEMKRIKSGADGVMESGWLSRDMILMKNDEWLIYRNHCPKEGPSDVEDIFLAQSSDGKWYYSTCHFCNEMYVLRSYQHDYGAPLDIETFAKMYNLREFDGKSNVCLEETQSMPTWPEEEW